MSRLYDRVMTEGCRPFRLDALVPSSLIVPERGSTLGERGIPIATESLEREAIDGLPVVVLDDAAEYVARLTVTPDFGLKEAPTRTLQAFYGVIRPPFERCFLEFSGRHWGRPVGTRVGWLVEVEEAGEAPATAPAWLAEARWFLSMSLLTEPARKGVVFGPCMTHVIPLNLFGEPCRPEGAGPRIREHPPSMTPPPTDDEGLYLSGAALYLVFPAMFGLSLMNCKNVDVRRVDPPSKLSRRVARRKGVPLTSYYVLDIEPMRRVLDREGEAQTKGLSHALHLCRGHFKTYTEDAPLLGKRVGTYWWPAQIRGRREHGVVEKDYRIRLDEGPARDYDEDLGRDYVEANEHPEIAPTAPEHNGRDPDLGGRGLKAHNVTQNLLAAAAREAGYEPRRPKPSEPQYDLAWESGETTWVAEVKSITPRNEERQLRLGLGQVIRYRQLLAEDGRAVRALIATEREPSDPSWAALCEDQGIVLAWPGAWRFA